MEKRQDELSLHLRIPAEKVYLGNAVLTLEGICEHFSIEDVARERIVTALQEFLKGALVSNYSDSRGLFDLKFSVFKDKLQITVEDFMFVEDVEEVSVKQESENSLKDRLSKVSSLVDELKVLNENRRNSCYSMQFNL